MNEAASTLGTARAEAVAHLARLEAAFAELVAASEGSNADDEHDPEGATIGFERAQLTALIDQARGRLADLDTALERVAAGTYGTCRQCGQPIALARLAARPSALTCIGCAT